MFLRHQSLSGREYAANEGSSARDALLADDPKPAGIEPHRRFHEHHVQVRPVPREVEQRLTHAAAAFGVELWRDGGTNIVEEQQTVLGEQPVTQRDIVKRIRIRMIGVEINDLDFFRQDIPELGCGRIHLQRLHEILDAGLRDKLDKDLEIVVLWLKAVERPIVRRLQRGAHDHAGRADMRADLQDTRGAQREDECVQDIACSPRRFAGHPRMMLHLVEQAWIENGLADK